MRSPTLEQLFVRFRRRGDARAIAEIYERVAGDLLLAASHVAHRRGDAEDLVQATFLAAMESAERFDDTRPLMAWLVGILVHLAKHEHRRQSRMPDPDRLPPRVPADPSAAAEERELAEQIVRVLEEIPPGYRQVLNLRFVHGLSPVEIAHTLGLPPGTVKSRLSRGTEMLRRILPVGFAAATALLVTPSRGLAAVREVVLERAREIGALRAHAWSIGWLRPRLIGVALVAVGAMATWLTFGMMGSGAPPGGAGTVRTAGGEASAGLASGTPSSARASSLAAAGARHPALASDEGSLRLRVHWYDGASAVGVHVAVVATNASDPLLHERWQVSDVHGEVVFERLAAGRYRAHAHRGGAADAVVRAGGESGGELTVPRGIDLSGVVEDGPGKPLAGAAVWISRRDHLDEGRVVAMTDAAGRFRLRSIEPGRSVSALAKGFAPWPMRRVEGEPGQALEWRLDMSDQHSVFRLIGRVIDETGAPVEGALVQVGNRRPLLSFADDGRGKGVRMPPRLLTTDADGGFVVDGVMLWDHRVNVWARAPGTAVTGKALEFTGKEEHVELRLRRGGTVEGRVYHRDGLPIAGVRITAIRPAMGTPDYAPRWAQSETTTAPDGSYRLEHVAGDLELHAVAPSGARASTALKVQDGARWDVKLEPSRRLAGVVMDAQGQPLPGMTVHVIAPPGRIDVPNATTGDGGRFEVPELEPCSYRLEVLDPSSAWSGPAWSADGVAPQNDLRIVVAADRLASGAVEGTIVDAAGQPAAARMYLHDVLDGIAYAKCDPSTGRFRIAPLPPLPVPYAIHVETDVGHQQEIHPVWVHAAQTSDVGTIALPAMGSVRLRVHGPAGAMTARGTATVTGASGLGMGTCDVVDGATDPVPLPPGDYRVQVSGEAAASLPVAFSVRPDDEAVVDVALLPGSMYRFVLPEAGPQPSAVEMRIEERGGGVVLTRMVAVAAGEPLAATLPAGAYTATLTSSDGRFGRVAFSAGNAPQEMRVDLR